MWIRRCLLLAATVAIAVPVLSQTPEPEDGNLTLPPGTFVKVRVDQRLSSNRNYAGDAFTATLSQSLIAGGIVVARRGQTVGGRVVEAVKAGKTKGTSRLAVEITELTLVDGRQVPVRTRLIEYQAGSSAGRDAGAVATTTGVGAAIGAAADGGFGAGVGAIAGAAAGMIGVLATRGKPAEIYPEAQLTFRLEDPLTVSTEPAPQAFRQAAQEDYEQTTLSRQRRPQPPRYYYSPWDWWYRPYYPGLFYGPSIYVYSGPRWIGHRGFGRRW